MAKYFKKALKSVTF